MVNGIILFPLINLTSLFIYTYQWVEDTLIKNGTFALPGNKALKRKSASITYVLVDGTKSPINRPPKDQKAYYSGKKGTPCPEDPGHT
jgi:hypothetical protein